VGFVVDDAIVMLENISRHIEMGKTPLQATLDGSREISFTIVSMTISLIAVFIPVLFMGRHTRAGAARVCRRHHGGGDYFGFVSLTLTPMMCSRILKPHAQQKHGACSC